MKKIRNNIITITVILLTLPILGLSQEFTESEKQILQNLDLSEEENEILKDINDLKRQAELWVDEAEKIDEEIKELEEICKLSESFSDIKNKAKRKKNRYLDFKVSMLYDAEEFFEMANDLRYNLYKNHWYEISGESVTDLKNKSEDAFAKAKDIRFNVYENMEMKDGAEELKKARKIEEQAILTQLSAYTKSFNIEAEYGFFADNSDDFKKLMTVKNEEMENADSKKENISMKEKIENEVETVGQIKSETEKDKYLYRVQVGAFLNKVSEDEFHGLYPLTVEKKDGSIFTKFLVGRYFSSEAAIKAMKVIKKNTKYKDAFVVAYKNGERVQHEFLNNALSSAK